MPKKFIFCSFFCCSQSEKENLQQQQESGNSFAMAQPAEQASNPLVPIPPHNFVINIANGDHQQPQPQQLSQAASPEDTRTTDHGGQSTSLMTASKGLTKSTMPPFSPVIPLQQQQQQLNPTLTADPTFGMAMANQWMNPMMMNSMLMQQQLTLSQSLSTMLLESQLANMSMMMQQQQNQQTMITQSLLQQMSLYQAQLVNLVSHRPPAPSSWADPRGGYQGDVNLNAAIEWIMKLSQSNNGQTMSATLTRQLTRTSTQRMITGSVSGGHGGGGGGESGDNNDDSFDDDDSDEDGDNEEQQLQAQSREIKIKQNELLAIQLKQELARELNIHL